MTPHSIRRTALLAVIVLVVTACTGGSSAAPSVAPSQAAPSTPASPSATPIPVTKESVQLDFVLSGSWTPLLWGVDKGYFESRGIDLDIVPGRGTDLALAEINAGRVKFAFVDLTNYVIQRAAAETETTAIYVYNNIATTGIASLTPINEPEDMAGKTFGTVAQSSGKVNIPLTIHQNGVEWDETTLLQLMDFSVLYPTLFSGGIDTAEVGLAGSWESAYLRGQEEGIELHLKLMSDWGFLDYSKVLIVRNDAIEQERDLVERMVAAISESELDALANATGAEMYELLKAVDPQAEEAVVELLWENFKTYVKDPGPMDPEVIQYKIDYLKENQNLETDLTPDDLYTNEFVPGA
jgi:ABC-type nitrate/sulfonate/bicarbonate transport system substrate-binding protein